MWHCDACQPYYVTLSLPKRIQGRLSQLYGLLSLTRGPICNRKHKRVCAATDGAGGSAAVNSLRSVRRRVLTVSGGADPATHEILVVGRHANPRLIEKVGSRIVHQTAHRTTSLNIQRK